ncbi:MAG: FtsX-like permease family protein, partial [Vicinamibacterales bacterium]
FILVHRGPSSGTNMPQPVRMRVVGVVGDVWEGGGPPDMYVPLQQLYWSELTILARRAADRSLASELRKLVTSMNSNVPVLFAQTLKSLQNGPVETQLRIAATVAGSVGLVGLLLAGIGIYGVTAYAVTRRTREIGIRLSLGARRTDVIGMVMRQGMTLVAIGSAIGLILSVGVGRLLSGARFDVPPPDVATSVGAAALFAVVGLLACYVPVRRATQIGAMEALRYE